MDYLITGQFKGVEISLKLLSFNPIQENNDFK